MNILITNLHSNLVEADLLRMFTKFGEVESVKLVRDQLNNRSLRRAFIAMPVRKQAEQAIVTLNRSDVKGSRVVVSEVLYDPAPNSSWSYSPDA